MNLLQRTVGAIFSLFIVFVLTGCDVPKKEFTSAEIGVNDISFQVQVADTPRERAKGLSGRESLAEEEGMLFVYEEAGRYSFWMKGMQFPLDFIWIKGDRVVDLDRNVLPGEVQLPKTISPKVKVDKVLEVKAGSIEEYNIEVGDRIRSF